MVELNQTKNYSMPRQSGLYPPPPIEYKNARALVTLFQCAPNLKDKYLPPELSSVEEGLDTIIILEYPNTSIGPYNEGLIAFHCLYGEIPGYFIFSIYVNTDVALGAGREIWGIPKKMSTIQLSSIKNNQIKGSVIRKGSTLLEVEAEVLNNPPGIDPKELFQIMPFYNLKLIPDIADNSKVALRQLTETSLVIKGIYKNNAIVPINIKSEYSQYDIAREILNGSNMQLGGFYVEYDFTLPNGRVLE